MKLSISVPNYMNDILEQIMKRQGSTKSAVIQHALTIYMMIEKHAPDQMAKLATMIPEGQTQIYDYLKNNDN